MLAGPESLSRSREKESYAVFCGDDQPEVCSHTNGAQREHESFATFRLCSTAALALVEIIVLGLYVDTGDFSGGSTLWGPLVEYSPQILQILIAATTVVVFWRLGVKGAALKKLPHVSPAAFGSLISVNLIAFATFTLMANVVFAASSSQRYLLFFGWASAGLIAVLALAASVLPLRSWQSTLVQSRGLILVALATGFLARMIGGISSQFWLSLADGTFVLVHFFLSLLYPDVVVDPSEQIIGTSRFRVVIAPSCSGYEGLGLVGVFLMVFCFVFRERLRFPHVFILFPVGLALVWVLNAARIAMLIAIGTSWSSELALGGFHSQAGWLAFNFVALSLVLVGTRVRYFALDQHTVSPVTSTNLTACYLGPFLASILAGMAIATMSVNAGDLQALCRIIAAGVCLYVVRERLQIVRWSLSWEAIVLGVLVYGIWILLVDASQSSSVTGTNASMVISLSLLIRFCSYVFLTPIVEELAFRGFILRRIVSEDFENAELRPFPIWGVAISSLTFGLFHGQNWIPGVISGLIFAIAFLRKGNLGDSIAAHATTNGLLAVHAVLTGDSALWS